MKAPMKTHPAHEALYQDLCAALKRHEVVPPIEVLAVVSNLVGKLVGMQDSTKYTPERIMEMVARNVEMGNAHLVTAAGMGELNVTPPSK